MSERLKTSMIDQRLLNLCDEHGSLSGRVHSVFDRAINIDLDECARLLTLLAPDRSMQAMSIRLQKLPKLVQGEKIFLRGLESIRSRSLMEGDCELVSQGGVKTLRCPWQDFDVYDASTSGLYLSQPESLYERLVLLLEILRTDGEAHGALPLLLRELPLSRESAWILDDFEKWSQRYEEALNLNTKSLWQEMTERAINLLGYGTGMTPFMDDFFSGLMVMQTCLLRRTHRIAETAILPDETSCAYSSFVRQVQEAAQARTNRISAELIYWAAAGEVSEALKEVLHSLCMLPNDSDFPKKLQKLLKLGSSSGTDIASGVAYAMLATLRARHPYRYQYHKSSARTASMRH